MASFKRPGARTRIPGLYLAGGACIRGRACRWRRSPGGSRRTACCGTGMAPALRYAVDRDGYVWWYVDALSADGRQGLTIIAFIGSVFSPYYAWDPTRDPFDHCAVNVVLYGERANRFCMTERGRASLHRDADHIRIGPSGLSWDGNHADDPHRRGDGADPLAGPGNGAAAPGRLHARTAPPRRPGPASLVADGALLPVEVALEEPGIAWRGTAYFDTNHGDTSLEAAFRDWTWCRADLRDGRRSLRREPNGRQPAGADPVLCRRRDAPGHRSAAARRAAADAVLAHAA